MAATPALWRWVTSFVGTALLAALVWFFGPFLPALAGWGARLAVILGMVALWAAGNLAVDLYRRRREAALAAGIAAAAPDPAARAAAEEAAALRERLERALALLRKARRTRGYLYEQPWYVIIGPPGAGKTTALFNAGLRFPLAAELGQQPLAGVGGTRLCEWLFADEAVLIDTAGRYTTQDSDAAVDRAGWEAFLDLLKRTRPRQPLNGVIVAIAIPDIAAAPRAERLAHARAIRRRIRELEDKFELRLPVYALFTKADLIAGFTEFFDDLDRDRRAQVWGATFPLGEGAASPLAGFAAEFAALVARLNQRLFDRLQAERSPDRRALIAGFPAQFAGLGDALGEFMDEAFGGSRLEPGPLLRGFYLTSGTQEGTPIDRLTGFLARSFGIDQRRIASLRPERGRSYFLARLLKEVIFGEAMLVAQRPGAARRRLALRAGAFAAAGLAVLGGGGALWHADTLARRQLGEASAALAGYEAAYRKIAAILPPHPVADGDLPRLLPLLDKARALPWGYDSRHPAGSPGWRLPGLSPQRELAAGARAIYRHALERVLLPRLIWRLEAEMRGNLERPEFLYQATRVYLMLGAQGPLDRDVVRQWMAADWQAAYPDPSGQVQRDLLRHLDALLAAPLPAVPLDPELIAKARAIISRVPLASRIYSRIAAVARTMPPWRPADVLGPAGRALFVRASGKKLSEGIPGFYTVDGFYGALLPALGKLTREEASESWVVGKQAGAGSPDVPALERDVIALYEADYAKHWDALLADLDLVRLRTAQEGAQDLFVLASPQSPLRALLVALARQLTLTRKPAGKTPSLPAPPPSLQGLFARPEPPGEEIDKRYRALREFVGGGPGAPIDQTLQAIDRLGRQLAQLASAPPGTPPAPPSGEDPVLLLRAAMMQAPQPVARWIGTIIADAVAIRSGSAAAGLKKAFNAGDGPAALCREAVRGRYPFSPEAGEDIPLDDFIKLFSPGGLLNGFFNTELKPYVDTSGRVWRGRPVDGVAPPVSPAALAAFQRAATIRDVFFGAGGNMPSVRFDVIPISLDAGAKQVTLELGGTTIRYAHGPAPATQIVWPGPSGIDNAKLAFDPPPQGGGGLLQASGPWALFRLFDQGRLTEAGSPERYRLTFTLGERQAVFELRAGSVLNPFARGLLQGFRCPSL
jgi:type VI secretion system protein ImpL